MHAKLVVYSKCSIWTSLIFNRTVSWNIWDQVTLENLYCNCKSLDGVLMAYRDLRTHLALPSYFALLGEGQDKENMTFSVIFW